jgi:hypothetical protein
MYAIGLNLFSSSKVKGPGNTARAFYLMKKLIISLNAMLVSLLVVLAAT